MADVVEALNWLRDGGASPRAQAGMTPHALQQQLQQQQQQQQQNQSGTAATAAAAAAGSAVPKREGLRSSGASGSANTHHHHDSHAPRSGGPAADCGSGGSGADTVQGTAPLPRSAALSHVTMHAPPQHPQQNQREQQAAPVAVMQQQQQQAAAAAQFAQYAAAGHFGGMPGFVGFPWGGQGSLPAQQQGSGSGASPMQQHTPSFPPFPFPPLPQFPMQRQQAVAVNVADLQHQQQTQQQQQQQQAQQAMMQHHAMMMQQQAFQVMHYNMAAAAAAAGQSGFPQWRQQMPWGLSGGGGMMGIRPATPGVTIGPHPQGLPSLAPLNLSGGITSSGELWQSGEKGGVLGHHSEGKCHPHGSPRM
jgi:hypothetical protein